MSARHLLLAAYFVMVAACSKGRDLPCASGTILFRFSCADDLKGLSHVSFKLARGTENGSTFKSDLTCPASRLFEVQVPDYVEKQSFSLVMQGFAGELLAPVESSVSVFELLPQCTPISVSLSKPSTGDAGDASENDGGSDVAMQNVENGEICQASSQCRSGACSDGICCASVCNDPCYSCNQPSQLGKCVVSPKGTRPNGTKSCTAELANSCGLDGTCDGEGSCAKWPDGTVCAPGQCEGAGTRDRKVCSAGLCKASMELTCAPFSCDPANNSCFDICDTNAQCDTGKPCAVDPQTQRKSCGKKPLGAICELAAECESSNCADGICCSTKCDGPCVSCRQVGFAGTCKPVPLGADDPRASCAVTLPTQCGTTGKCDGNGGCAKFESGTKCTAPSCSSGVATPASACDGNGQCVPPPLLLCEPFSCSGNACASTCTKDDECSSGNACLNGTCGAKSLGQQCMSANECKSKLCVDGVCCDSACDGTCQFCANPAMLGKCIDVPAGADDLRKACAATPVASCGTNGKCDGKRGCQLQPAGAECEARSCEAQLNQERAAKQCDGKGMCLATKPERSCAPFTCSGNTCAISCTRTDQCISPNTCAGSVCGKLADGQSCGSDASKCASGVCAQGVCCATACSGTCRSCAISGSEGACINVPDKQDPLNQCEATSSTTCATTGSCDGSGKCAVYAAGVACNPASCSADASQSIAGSTCDGAARCVAPGGNSCANNLICGGSPPSCKLTCTSDGDCRNGTKCNARTGQCAAVNGTACTSGGQCGSDQCIDGFCCNSKCDGACMACASSVTGLANGACGAAKQGTSDLACPVAGCTNNTALSASFCDGAGSCGSQSTNVCSGSNPVCEAGSCVVCTPGTTATCGAKLNSKGTCATGTTTCTASRQWGACNVTPQASDTCVLNNDDSCNGVVNEGCTCGGFTMSNSPASGLPNAASYDSSAAGVVTDKVTGLVWDRAVSSTLMPQADAAAYCAGNRAGGFADWRVPNRVELVSLLDLQRTTPYIDATAFPGTPAELFWTSRVSASSPTFAWTVRFGSGDIRVEPKTVPGRVRCVRPAGAPKCYAQRFEARTVGTVSSVYDAATGLTWQRQENGSSAGGAQSKATCTALGNGFRMPSIKEFESIVDDTRTPAVDPAVFQGQLEGCTWTADLSDQVSPIPGTQVYWYIQLTSGSTSTLTEDEGCNVRCVK